MFNKIKVLSLAACAALVLQSCHSDDDALFATVPDAAPQEVGDISGNAYGSLRSGSSALDSLFVLAGTVAGTGTAVGDEPCNVKMHKMTYDTVGGAGEATTSTGVVMVPYGDNAACSGSRPVVLYAHGTNADRNYDLSAFPSDTSNPAAGEAGIMLAFYAAQGYVVVAPNYAGYADSTLSYHPYVDEVQQSTEMINALDHVRTYAADIGAELSPKLFITGLSQGGYVAMATHKALQAKGETVTASIPVSGPYMISKFLDKVMDGHVNFGATTFAPMYLTALDRAHNIYDDDATGVYAIDDVDNIFPNPGADSSSLPSFALFSQGSSPSPIAADAPIAFQNSAFANEFPIINNVLPLGFAGSATDVLAGIIPYDTNHLLTDQLRSDYLAGTAGTIGNKVKELALEGDLNNWTPTAPLVMCGSSNDPVVYFDMNTEEMEDYWGSGFATKLDLSGATPSTAFALIQGAWAQANVSQAEVHGTTGAYCAGAGLGLFNSML